MISVRRVVPVLGDDLGQFRTHDLPLPLRRGQDALVVGDLGFEVVPLVDELLALQGGQLAQLHVQDRARLDLVDLQQPDQALLGLGGRRAGPDQRDDLVDPVDGLEQRGHDVQPLGGLAQPEPGAPDDDLDLVRHPVADHLVQAQRARYPVDQGQHVGAERVLQLGVLVEVVQNDLGYRVPLQHDHQPLAGAAAALVLHAGDPVDPAIPDQLGDLLRQVVPVDLERQFLDDQAGPAPAVLLDLDHGAHGDRAAPGPVGVPDAAPADDQAVGREVRSRDPLHQRVEQFLVGGIEVIQVPLHARGDLAQVVRRDLGRHADRDPVGPVDEQVREPAGQHHRLGRAAVVVVAEVDGVLVDVPQHLHGQRGQAALGVPHGGGRVVPGRAEVALGVDQRHPHRPRLRHPDQRVVDRAVAVRVVVAHDVADDPRALEEPAVGPEPAVEHGVQDPHVDRLQPVAHVGQRPADDDRHRIVDVAALHLVLDVDGLDAVVPALGNFRHFTILN